MTTPQPGLTLRVDDSGTAFGDTPTWADYTDALLTAGAGSPIEITHLRQDEQAEPSPSTCSFTLDNTSGAYTPGNPAAAVGWDVGARVNVRLTSGAITSDRFDGYVDTIEPAYPGPDWSVVRVSCTDVTARLAIGQPLHSLVVQEMLADNPTYLYPLSEPGGSVSAGDISTNSNPVAIRVDGKYGAGTVDFGADLGMPDPATGVTFGPNSNLASGTVSVLSIVNNGTTPFPPPTGAHSQGCWFISPESAPTYNSVLLGQTHGSSGFSEVTLIMDFFGRLVYTVQSVTGDIAVAQTTATYLDGARHAAWGTLSADQKTVRLYVDGGLAATDTSATALVLTGLKYNHIGGFLTTIVTGWQYPGTIALVALYSTELAAARILELYQAGVGTLVEPSDDRFARLAGYGNVPTTGLPTGLAEIGHQNTSGKTVLEALAQVARSEGSVAYATGDGLLTFQARDHRYNATTGLELTSEEVDPGTTTRRDRQGFANEFTVNRDGGASQRVVDSASQLDKGRFDGGSLDVAVSTDDDARQIAAWQVNTRNTPRTRLPSVLVDLITRKSGYVDLYELLYEGDDLIDRVLSAEFSTLLTITDLPDQAPDSELSVFVEGWTETIGVNAWTWTAFTSPNLPPVWQLEDPVFGQIDAANVIAL